MQNMQSTDMRALALSIGREAWSSELGVADVAAPVGPCLGKGVPWGACFEMGVDLEEAMKMST